MNMWNPRQISRQPSLQSVPEGAPVGQGSNFNLVPILPPTAGYNAGGMQQQQQHKQPPHQHQQQQQAMPLNLPPLQSNQYNYSYVQYAGVPTQQRSGGLASSSESGPEADNGEEQQSNVADGQSGGLKKSYPSMGNLSAQMNNQLQIKRQESHDNLLGVVNDGSGLAPAGPDHMDLSGFHQGGTVTTTQQQPIMPQKARTRGAWRLKFKGLSLTGRSAHLHLCKTHVLMCLGMHMHAF